MRRLGRHQGFELSLSGLQVSAFTNGATNPRSLYIKPTRINTTHLIVTKCKLTLLTFILMMSHILSIHSEKARRHRSSIKLVSCKYKQVNTVWARVWPSSQDNCKKNWINEGHLIVLWGNWCCFSLLTKQHSDWSKIPTSSTLVRSETLTVFSAIASAKLSTCKCPWERWEKDLIAKYPE